MEFDNHIKSVADNCFQAYQENNREIGPGVSIDKREPLFSSTSYKTAIVIPYENKKEKKTLKVDSFWD